MRLIALFLVIPFFTWAQFEPNERLHIKTSLLTDSGSVKGYFLYQEDSVVILSRTKRYSSPPNINIPINTIQNMRLKNTKGKWGAVAVMSALGFLVTAGILQNRDYNNDGRTSFFELIWSAVEGTTSSNRNRRNTALIAGGAGGAAGFIITMLTGKKLSLVFPVHNRNNFYAEKRASVSKFIEF